MKTLPQHVRNPGSSASRPSASSAPGGTPAMIAGYRVLRRLGSGSRADLYVGVAPVRSATPGPDADRPEPGGPSTPVVLKVFRPATNELSVEREVRALTTLAPGRLPTLFDVGTLSDGRTCLVLEQLTGGALSGLLEGRRRILPGEAVTVLAPVAATLAELLAIGLVHPALNLSTVLFDSRGRPVVTGLGELRALPEAGRGRTEAHVLVHDRLAQVVRAVLDQVDPARPVPTALRDLDRWCAVPPARPVAGALDELEHLLFAWAEAVPVRLGHTRDAGSGMQSAGDWLRRPPRDDLSGREPVAANQGEAGETWARRMLGRLVSRARARARAVLRRPTDGGPADEVKAGQSRRLRLGRGPLLLAALVAAVSTGTVLTALGPGGAPGTAGAGRDASEEPAAVPGPPSEQAEPAVDSEGNAVSGDDPVAAVPALLRLRSRCLGEVSVVCLDGVHQPQSAALAADSHSLRMIQQGAGTPEREDLASWAVSLMERTGDVALVSLRPPEAERQPASVLVVKGEAGWRIRDFFDY